MRKYISRSRSAETLLLTFDHFWFSCCSSCVGFDLSSSSHRRISNWLMDQTVLRLLSRLFWTITLLLVGKFYCVVFLISKMLIYHIISFLSNIKSIHFWVFISSRWMAYLMFTCLPFWCSFSTLLCESK